MLAMYQRIMYQLFRAIVRRHMMMRNKVCADVMKLYADAFHGRLTSPCKLLQRCWNTALYAFTVFLCYVVTLFHILFAMSNKQKLPFTKDFRGEEHSMSLTEFFYLAMVRHAFYYIWFDRTSKIGWVFCRCINYIQLRPRIFNENTWGAVCQC